MTTKRDTQYTLTLEGGKLHAKACHTSGKVDQRHTKGLMKALSEDFAAAAALFLEEGEACHELPSAVNVWLSGNAMGDTEAKVNLGSKQSGYWKAKQRITTALREWAAHETYGLSGAKISMAFDRDESTNVVRGTFTLSLPEAVLVPEDAQNLADTLADTLMKVHHMEQAEAKKVAAAALANAFTSAAPKA